MIFFDILFLGIYKILDKTIYVNSNSYDGFGIKEHTLFINFIFLIINIQTLLRFIFIKFFQTNLKLSQITIVAIAILVIGYIIYYKQKRAEKILSKPISNNKSLLFIFASIVYIVFSVYFMISIGNYVRYQLGM